MPILATALDERLLIRLVAMSVEHDRTVMVFSDALPFQIGHMLRYGSRSKGLALMPRDPGFDGDPP